MRSKILIFVLFFASIHFSKAQSILVSDLVPYQWQEPGIQGFTINDCVWLPGNRIVAVGAAGTILVSNDSSLTWEVKQIPTRYPFYSVCNTDSNTLYAAGGGSYGLGFIFKSTDGGNNWTQVYDSLDITLRAIHFANDTIGYAAGNLGKIIKTTDGGQTWNPLVTGTVNYFECIWFLNPDTGYAGGTNYGLYKTTNGGISWSAVSSYSQTNCYSLYFVNDTLGWAGAYNGKIFRTFNGGLTWIQQLNQANFEEITDFSFSSPTRGIAVSDAYIYRTINGVNWTATFIGGMNTYSCLLSPNNHIFMMGVGGGIRRAWSWGTQYTQLNQNYSLVSLRDIEFLNPVNGWVAGDNGLFARTTNGGLTWQFDTANFFGNISDIEALSTSSAMAVDYNGDFIKITNNGNTITQSNLTSEWLTGVDFPTPQIGYICGYAGTAFKTVNAGTSWIPINTGTNNDLVDIQFINSNIGYILSYYGEILKTTNAGVNWTSSSISGAAAPFNTFYFVSADTGYLVSDDSKVFITTDGSQTWNQISTICIDVVSDIRFLNSNIGYATGYGLYSTCDIAYTYDGGITWNTYNLPMLGASAICPIDTSNIYLVTSNTGIIKVGNSLLTSDENPVLNQTSGLIANPNPANQVLELKKSHSNLDNDWFMYDMTGSLIKQGKIIEGNSTQIDIGNIENGCYLIKCGTNHKKIIVQH